MTKLLVKILRSYYEFLYYNVSTILYESGRSIES